MNILCITHADFEPPGIIEPWSKDRNYAFCICKPYKGEDCLQSWESEAFDFLIVMGGPQSPLKIDKYPYLKDEITLIKKAISKDKTILGFCLGAQLVGEALGATTQKSPEKEIGVFPISLSANGLEDPLLSGYPRSFPVIHWHNDMPGETQDSKVLAYSAGCPKQIIRYGSKIYGFQCHLEITKTGIADLIKASQANDDLKPGKFVQSPETLLKQDYDSINQSMIKILDRLAIFN